MPNAGEIILDVRAKHDLLQGDLNKAKGSIQATAGALERGLNTGGMMNAISMLGGMMPGLGGQISMVAGQMSQLGSVLPNLASQLGVVGIAATAMTGELIAAGVAAAAIGTAGVKAAMAREDLLTAYTVLLKSKDAAAALVAEMQKLAARTPMETNDIANAGRKLLSYGFGIKEIIPTITALGDAAAVSGRGAEGLMTLADAIGKVKSIGRLQGEELNRFTDAGVNPMKEIGLATGTTGGIDTRKLMESGAISAAVAIPAIMRAINTQAAGAMDALSKTLSGHLSTLKDDWNELLVQVGKPILPALSTALQYLSSTIQRLKDEYLPAVRVRLSEIWQALEPVREAFKKLWESVAGTTLPDVLTRIKLAIQTLSLPLVFVVNTFRRLADMIRNYFSGDNPMTTFWVTFGLAVVPITMTIIGLIKTIKALRDTTISVALILEGFSGNLPAIVAGIAGAALAGTAAVALIKRLNKDMEQSSGMSKMEEEARSLGEELEAIADNKAISKVAENQAAAADAIASTTKAAADAAAIKSAQQANAEEAGAALDKLLAKNAELRDAVKKQAAEEANAVVDGLRKQFDAHQEYVNKLKAVYDRYVSSTAAVRSRMSGITVDNVGHRKQPEWDKYRDTIQGNREAQLNQEYGVTQRRIETKSEMREVIKGLSDLIRVITNRTIPGVAT